MTASDHQAMSVVLPGIQICDWKTVPKPTVGSVLKQAPQVQLVPKPSQMISERPLVPTIEREDA